MWVEMPSKAIDFFLILRTINHYEDSILGDCNLLVLAWPAGNRIEMQ